MVSLAGRVCGMSAARCIVVCIQMDHSCLLAWMVYLAPFFPSMPDSKSQVLSALLAWKGNTPWGSVRMPEVVACNQPMASY